MNISLSTYTCAFATRSHLSGRLEPRSRRLDIVPMSSFIIDRATRSRNQMNYPTHPKRHSLLSTTWMLHLPKF